MHHSKQRSHLGTGGRTALQDLFAHNPLPTCKLGAALHLMLGINASTLVCDDYAGYKALLSQGAIEAGCMAHARRKFF